MPCAVCNNLGPSGHKDSRKCRDKMELILCSNIGDLFEAKREGCLYCSLLWNILQHFVTYVKAQLQDQLATEGRSALSRLTLELDECKPVILELGGQVQSAIVVQIYNPSSKHITLSLVFFIPKSAANR